MDARQYSVVESLLDGRKVRIRAIRPDDKQVLREGILHLSEQSIYFRFFRSKRGLSEQELIYLTEIDFVQHVALLVAFEHDTHEQPLGVGRYIVLDDARSMRHAEVAFVVDDAHQGLGVGTLLLKHLAEIARVRGIAAFESEVLASNEKMLEVFKHSGLPMRHTLQDGVVHVSLALLAEESPPTAAQSSPKT